MLLLPYGLGAQGIYEVKYTFDNQPSIEYTALVFYYSENAANNIMRVRYHNTNGWNVAEQKIEPVSFKNGGKDYWVLFGKDASIVDGKDKSYIPDRIYLSKTAGETYYQPDFVASDGSNRTDIGKIVSFKVLSKPDVTNDYLSYFNWKWNDDDQHSFNGTVHLILVSNTNDLSLGKGFSENHRKLATLFRDIERTCHLNLDIIELTGSDFNKQNLRSRINNLSVNSNDVIFFYYSGHGYNDRQSEWPKLDMRQGLSDDLGSNSLYLAGDVYRPLIDKKARLTIVIGECCNKYNDNDLFAGTPIREDPILMAPSQNMLNASNLISLLNKSGRLLIRTSDTGEPSYYALNYGGDFCNNFITSLLNETGFTNTHGDVRWKDVVSSTISATLSDSPKSSSLQHVRYYSSIEEN